MQLVAADVCASLIFPSANAPRAAALIATAARKIATPRMTPRP